MQAETVIKAPMCCRTEMKVNMVLGRFVEMICPKCGDVVYVKKTSVFW
ncbi:MAG: hypothetical protein HYT72_02790 [Candidatus Aenigmarchaeota archaeon]|nr:hypothetical protein [Candidatus Aenigmarchaeota archaeon]